ncbi:MAG: hypothetical protein HGA96_02020 [Desulfobulbaceae bacterium]|nr:hypothetical protein [Desulfobulbaceae bacterium]
MVGKYFALVALVAGVGAMVSPGSVAAGGPCGEVLEKVCIGCHEKERFCERLGAPEKEWRALVKRMIANGAELEKDDIGVLAVCLSESAAEVKKVCGK